jgi:hypothetical protein
MSGMRERGHAIEPMDAFIGDEGGYTSVSVALALLLSLTLAFSAAAAGWMMARSSEVQEVADASALAGSQVVARYTTVAQVCDACVLSLGLCGVLVLGAGLIASAVPVIATAAPKIIDAGHDILDARRDFADSASKGLADLERALPTLVILNSYDVVEANEADGISYGGCAIPFPLESQSDFGVADDVDGEELEEDAGRMQEASEKAREASERADAALEEGWRADCGDEPRNMQERAGRLAGLSGSSNPDFKTPQGWNFGVALSRSRAYYAKRLATEAPEGDGVEARADSAARSRFYSFALDQMNSGHYRELPDGTVDIDLPRLPHNAEETMTTTLYTERVWPCTSEEGGITLHAYAACPGATGASAGSASLQDIDAGRAHVCPRCRFDVEDMGDVASASTNIDNGYEHYWRRVVDAADDYEKATDELAEAQEEMRSIGEEGASEFDKALEQLKVARPNLCPPGAWGCVSVVGRGEGTQVPALLTSGWISGSTLPAGVAVSAAVLAPDDATAENNVLASFFDSAAEQSATGGAIDGICGLWGRLLVSYGSSYESVSGVADDLFDSIDTGLGTSVGSWLKGVLSETVSDLGFEPADMRLRKPVLTNTREVLEKAGYDDGEATRLIQAIPASGSPEEVARALGLAILDEEGLSEITIAEIPIPGTGRSVPLTIDLRRLLGGDRE